VGLEGGPLSSFFPGWCIIRLLGHVFCFRFVVIVVEKFFHFIFYFCYVEIDRLCGLVVRVLDYRCRGPGFDSRAPQKKVVGLERGPLSLVSTTEELLDRKIAAPV
jgi:hypothetical protein